MLLTAQMKFAAAFAALALLTTPLLAGVKIGGSTRFQFSDQNAAVTFGCDEITNTSKEDATGTLQVKLWALDQPYKGGTLSGVLLGSYKLDGLNPNSHYTNISKKVTASLPSARKAYTLCISVSEYKNGQYYIADYRNFKDTTTLGPLANFTLTGPWRWQTSNEGGTVAIEVAKISHRRPNGTGTLKLAVWATRQPYKGGAISGFELGSVKKDPLKTGFAYTNVKNTAKYTRPPAGTYYVSIVLSEFSDNEFKIVGYLSSDKTSTF